MIASKVLLALAAMVVMGLGGLAVTRMAPPSTPAAQVSPTTAARPGEQTVEMTEGQLTQVLNSQLAGQPLGSTPLGDATLEHVDAQLRTGQMLANGLARVGSTSVPVTMTGHVDLQAGKPLVIIDDARAAGVTLPGSMKDSIQRTVQAQVDQEVSRMKLKVTSVTIADGKLIVRGTPSG